MQDGSKVVTRDRTRQAPVRPAHMTRPLPYTDMVPFNYHTYNPAAVNMSRSPTDSRSEIPLRAKSVSLSERPRSKYARNIHSADHRSRYPEKHFIHQPLPQPKLRKSKKVFVKQQNRKVIEKVPCAVSIQTLSIPTKYADHTYSTSKYLCNNERVDKTKSSNPPKQVSDKKRLCATTACGKETENKLLLQICEAQQVSDFERILNSNAIQCGTARGRLWRGCATVSSAAVLPRPRSAYSLEAVSNTYHQLFQQHEVSLRPLIDQYRKAAADDHQACPPVSFLQDNWFERLQNLSEFYEEDPALHNEIETITNRIVTEEINAIEKVQPSDLKTNKNFNVNLADLIGLRVNGEGFSPILAQDGISPEIDRGSENEAEDKVWLGPIMSANSDDPNIQNQTDTVDCLAQNLKSVKIDDDAKVPDITFSNCCDGCGRTDSSDNSAVDVYLAVPSIDSVDESRPPM